MSSAYDQQIKKLVDHIQTLNQALHERNMQIVQWQQVARAVQDERARLARGLMDQVRQALTTFAGRFQGLRSENQKLRVYVDHQRQLHEVVARDLQGQLKYALVRIEELARERGEWRQEIGAATAAAQKYQQQVQEQKGVISSQQAALTELKAQLEQAMRFAELEDQFKAEMAHLQREYEQVRSQLGTQDMAIAGKDRELRGLQETFDAFKVRANQEVQAIEAELRANRDSQANVDDRVSDMTALLANSEREVAKLFKELHEERTLRKELEIRLDSSSKDLSSHKRKLTKLEKERATAKGEQLTDLQRELAAMKREYAQLQQELTQALNDKTQFMQAVEGQKGKLRPLPPPAADEGR